MAPKSKAGNIRAHQWSLSKYSK